MRRASSPRSTPRVRPVERIELEESRLSPRLLLTIFLVLLGGVLLVWSLFSLLGTDPGWREITVASGHESNAGEYYFTYELGRSGGGAAAEYRGLRDCYTTAAEAAFRRYHPTRTWDGLHNLAFLNEHPNMSVELDSTLYAALVQLEAAGSRAVFGGPVWAEYEKLFSCQNDAEAYAHDPFANPEQAAYIAALAAFAASPDAISLTLADGRATLAVSADYLAFAEENGIAALLDFGWLENAFAIDNIADALTGAGYTAGAISSYDGFIRCLDASAVSYSLGLTDRVDNVVYPAAELRYTGPLALAVLRDYPVNALDDALHYYVTEAGEIRHPYLGADGLCRSACPGLVAYARTQGCAAVALAAADVFVAGGSPDALPAAGIETITFDRFAIRASDRSAVLTNLYPGYTVAPSRGDHGSVS